jgi:prolyl oligopeptidase
MSAIKYPETRTEDQVDNLHGMQVRDPYRWLEDVDSAATKDWVKRQNDLTFGFLERIPSRDRLRSRLHKLWDYEKALPPFRRGQYYFQFRNTGLQNQNVLYVSESTTEQGRILLDPNLLSEDGTAALNTYTVSEDGKWLAYAISGSGSDWQDWHIREVATGTDLPEILHWSKFSGAAFAERGEAPGFYYARYPEPAAGEVYEGTNYNQKLYFHRLNTAQEQDALAYERPDQPEWGFYPEVSPDGRYLLVAVSQGTDVRNRFFYQDLSQAGAQVVELVSELEAAYEFVGNTGSTFFLRTDLQAPRGRLIAIDLERPEGASWRTVIPESPDVLEAVRLFNNQLVAVYMHDAHEELRLFSLDGAPLGEVSLPGPGSITHQYIISLSGRPSQDEMFYLFQSFAHPISVYRYDFKSGRSELLFTPRISFDFDSVETRQVFVTSKDGTQVPMFLVHKKGLELNGRNPTLLYGYGGFYIPIQPLFETGRLAWLEMGGVYASANLRGGSEYGEEWHQGGMLDRKQNVFDDFIACAEWLIREKITSTAKLAIHGRSNGGLLVGACMTQRPELFGACLPAVGVMDMLRFHKFTIGWAWVSDYGSPDDPQQFRALLAYSPYHNLRLGMKYPATLISTADHDDRVVPGHSFKFAAALQNAQAGDAPVLIRIETKAGHGFGKPTGLVIEELADEYAFLVKELGMEG